MHTEVQILKITKITAAPSKPPLQPKQITMENTVILIKHKYKTLFIQKEPLEGVQHYSFSDQSRIILSFKTIKKLTFPKFNSSYGSGNPVYSLGLP